LIVLVLTILLVNSTHLSAILRKINHKQALSVAFVTGTSLAQAIAAVIESEIHSDKKENSLCVDPSDYR